MTRLPLLDCHAHIAPEASAEQLAKLSPAVVFAVTRSLVDAERICTSSNQHVVWGLGAHPASIAQGDDFDLDAFRRLVPYFALVGEIGLDRRSSHLDRQTHVFELVLRSVAEQPVLLSIHSFGCVQELLVLLQGGFHRGTILHWFAGNLGQVRRAVEMGCYFSANCAMDRRVLAAIPLDRILPETDYPATRNAGGSRPGDTERVEMLVASIHGLDAASVRRQFYWNLRKLALTTGAIDRMPETVANLLLTA